MESTVPLDRRDRKERLECKEMQAQSEPLVSRDSQGRKVQPLFTAYRHTHAHTRPPAVCRLSMSSLDLPGAKGDNGLVGATGSIGLQGSAGATGLQGQKGESGIQGTRGVKGEKGDGFVGRLNIFHLIIYNIIHLFLSDRILNL
mgnify:CR=1 FL=1